MNELLQSPDTFYWPDSVPAVLNDSLRAKKVRIQTAFFFWSPMFGLQLSQYPGFGTSAQSEDVIHRHFDTCPTCKVTASKIREKGETQTKGHDGPPNTAPRAYHVCARLLDLIPPLSCCLAMWPIVIPHGCFAGATIRRRVGSYREGRRLDVARGGCT